jgi:hypothetical protein
MPQLKSSGPAGFEEATGLLFFAKMQRRLREGRLPMRPTMIRSAALLVTCACLVLAASCRPTDKDEPPPAPPTTAAATRPAQAVRQLTAHLRNDELEAFAIEAVPPELHARLQAAWKEGRTRWPLDEMPFGRRLPSMLHALAEPGSEAKLQATFDRQFAGASGDLRSAALTLGQFGTQYIDSKAAPYSADERQHYAQLIAAASRWAAKAPLADRERARASIVQLAAAARQVRLASDADFRQAGMDASLRRIGPFAAAAKLVLMRYGLDIDGGLAALDASLLQQTGDQATVRMRYRFAGQDIDTTVSLQRINGRWYLSDYLRHAEAAVAAPLPPASKPGPGAAKPAAGAARRSPAGP